MASVAARPPPAHSLNAETAYTSTAHEASAEQNLRTPRGPTNAVLSFYQPPADGSPPHNYVEPLPGQPQRNFEPDEQNVQINDVRGREHEFTLDSNAFAALKSISSAMTYEDWESDEKIKEIYYPETEKLLLHRLPGAHRIIFFDHTVRRSHEGARRAPVTRVHIDQTPASAAERVRLHAPDEAETLLRGRYRIVNVWRPLNGTVYAHPLAVADSATVRDEDLVSVEHRYPDRVGYTAGVRFNPQQKWYYWSGMTNDERLLLECFDSDERYGGRVPHTAFEDPNTPHEAPGRESIEVRALVFG